MMKQSYFILILIAVPALLWSRDIKSVSPNGRLEMILSVGDQISYRVLFDGNTIVNKSPIDLVFADGQLSDDARITEIKTNSIQNCITPLYGKNRTIDDTYNQTTVTLQNKDQIVVRTYDEGTAYRFVTARKGEITIKNEIANFNLCDDPAVFYPQTDVKTSWELSYFNYASVSAIGNGQMSITPVLCSRADGVKVVIAEADLHSYPGMFVTKQDDGFKAQFAAYPDSVVLGSWGNFVSVVKHSANFIALTDGSRAMPWRVIIVTDDDRRLVDNELIYKLSTPSRLVGSDWIKPGKAVWEWWHDARLDDVDFPSGPGKLSTQLYKYYIDFASENSIEYMLVDAGWSHIFRLDQLKPNINIPEVIGYGNTKGVGTFVWCAATALVDSTADKYLKMISHWGAAGVKVDFFDRDDQKAIEWYEMIARTAAKYRLMVDFHGCSKPTGLQRTYPNVLSFEAVRGAECAKWDHTTNPDYTALLPFTRMLCGSMDTTPGSLYNGSRHTFCPTDKAHPTTIGTRCNQIAMMIVFDQYFLSLSDSPTVYRKNPQMLNLISAIPVAYDKTVVLKAKVGEYVVVAKQKDNHWFIGGMTNWTARKMNIDFSFMPAGKKFEATIYSDKISSYYHADHYQTKKQTVDSATKLDVQLMSGGGFVIMLD